MGKMIERYFFCTKHCIINLYCYNNEAYIWFIQVNGYKETMVTECVYLTHKAAVGMACKLAAYVDENLETKQKIISEFQKRITELRGEIVPFSFSKDAWHFKINKLQGSLKFHVIQGWAVEPDSFRKLLYEVLHDTRENSSINPS